MPDMKYSTNVLQIKTSSKFTELFLGYTSMKAVTYVAETKYILEFLSKIGYESIELILGEEFSDLKKNLNVIRVEEILSRLVDGSLKVYTPHNRIHTKLYILQGDGNTRIITGSRNLQQSRSYDLAIVFDFSGPCTLLSEFQLIFDGYLTISTPTFDSLLDALNLTSDDEKSARISYWLENVEFEQNDVETPLVQIFSTAMEPSSEEILSIAPPKTKTSKKIIKDVFGDSIISESEDRIQVRKSDFLRIVNKEIGYPMMRINWLTAKLTLTFGASIYELTSDTLGDPAIVTSELELLERYIDACEPKAQDLDIEEIDMQKAGMYEIILYMFSAPFFHELMKLRAARYTVLQKRGPRFLVVYGQSHNGKTTLFEYCMKLMTGSSIKPLGSKDFKKSVVDKVRSFGTVFPLVFDDVSTLSDKKSQEIVKNYWEREWKSDVPTPQLVFSTNSPMRKDWLKTRSKFTTLPMYLSSSNEKKAELSSIIVHENRIFDKFRVCISN